MLAVFFADLSVCHYVMCRSFCCSTNQRGTASVGPYRRIGSDQIFEGLVDGLLRGSSAIHDESARFLFDEVPELAVACIVLANP